MLAWLAAIVISISPYAPETTDRVSLIEDNRLYSDNGDPVFRQIIFWDWFYDLGEFHVVAYRVVAFDYHSIQIGSDGCTVIICVNGDLIRVRSDHFRRTWTQTDPEVDDRQRFPMEFRRGIGGANREP